jgi:hypothetical protein
MFKNVILSFFTKGGIAVIGILMVPMMLQSTILGKYSNRVDYSNMYYWIFILSDSSKMAFSVYGGNDQ